MILYIDIETYSSVDIKSCGAYKYIESPDFEILLVAYAWGNGPVQLIDLASGEDIPDDLDKAIRDGDQIKVAHNAVFERIAFNTIGLPSNISSWHCSSVKSAYCGLPLSLDDVCKALGLGEDKAKMSEGRALIKYFCCPCKPSVSNGKRSRNMPEHSLAKWDLFGKYCMRDVEAMRTIWQQLARFNIPNIEREAYILDQNINDEGILIDADLVTKAITIDEQFSANTLESLRALTGLDNPNSVLQLKDWVSNKIGYGVESMSKDAVSDLIESYKDINDTNLRKVLELRQQASKSSVKKYDAMLSCKCSDNRARGLFQFYGASRTGRWSGRLIQLQNLPQNHLKDLDFDRSMIKSGDYDLVSILYNDTSSVLSQLIRTAFIAPNNYTYAVADFSAIEARVIAWLAGENWRLDVFKSHGKIYEASASMMFGVPIESVTKGSDLRQKGKIAELALGYQGGVGALKTMGGEKMGLLESEMSRIVDAWRLANPNIVKLWHTLDNAAKMALKTGSKQTIANGLISVYLRAGYMLIDLPSGRSLFYRQPELTTNRFGSASIRYKGMDQTSRQWVWQETYGGKLTENVVQAVARDLLVNAMLNIDKSGTNIVMHVHDEVVCEVPKLNCAELLKNICASMCDAPKWASGLPLNADGYTTDFYKKD